MSERAEDAARAIEYNLSERDYTRFSAFAFARNTQRWRFALLRRITLIAMALLAVFTVWTRWQIGDPLVDLGDIWIVLAALYVLAFPLFLSWVARKNFRSAAFAKMRAPMRLEISPEGLRSTGGVGESMMPWSSIIDIAATPEAAYLFILKNSAHIVPRHAFADAARFDDFVGAVMRYWRAGEAVTR
jgi:hypothetical protein